MATAMKLTRNHASRTERTLVAYIGLGWFVLVLAGSVLGTFVQYPPLFVLAVGGPVILFVAASLLSASFRRVVRALVGDP